MLLPEPSEAPATPLLCVTLHAKVVPETFDVKAIPVEVPLHIVCDVGFAVTLGIGFIVAVVCAVDVQPPVPVTVTVYVPVAAVVVPVIVGLCNVLVKLFGPLQL